MYRDVFDQNQGFVETQTERAAPAGVPEQINVLHWLAQHNITLEELSQFSDTDLTALLAQIKEDLN